MIGWLGKNQDEPQVPAQQTAFAGDEPLWEEPALPEQPASQMAVPPVAKTWYQKLTSPFGMVLGGVLGVTALLIVVVLLSRPVSDPDQLPSDQFQPAASPVTSLPDPITKRLGEIKTDLSKADPSQQSLPLPQVNYQLQLDEDDAFAGTE